MRISLTLFWERASADYPNARMYGLRDTSGSLISPIADLFPLDSRFSKENPSSKSGWIVIDKNLYKRLRSWSNAIKGFPYNSSGRFLRMLYVSAVTITTLGYGDIVPVSTRARMFVGGEATLGLILIGVFPALSYQKTDCITINYQESEDRLIDKKAPNLGDKLVPPVKAAVGLRSSVTSAVPLARAASLALLETCYALRSSYGYLYQP